MIWVVSAFCGPEAEVLEFGNAPIESDLLAIARMSEALGMSPLSISELAAYRTVARSFVRRERHIIRVVADELIRVGHMSGDELPRPYFIFVLEALSAPTHLRTLTFLRENSAHCGSSGYFDLKADLPRF